MSLICLTWGSAYPEFTAAFERYHMTTEKMFCNSDEATEETYKHFSRGEVYQKILDKQLVKELFKYLKKQGRDMVLLESILLNDSGEVDGYNIKILKEALTPSVEEPDKDIDFDKRFNDCIMLSSKFGVFYDVGLSIFHSTNTKERLIDSFEDIQKYKNFKASVEKYAGNFDANDVLKEKCKEKSFKNFI